jgi:cytochrome oxidase assembly protein ShyY1
LSGWEPKDKIKSNDRKIEEIVTIEGIIRKEDVTGSFVGDNIHVSDNWFVTIQPSVFKKFSTIETIPILIDQLCNPNFLTKISIRSNSWTPKSTLLD